MTADQNLPLYPPTHVRKSLTASQLTQLNKTITSALAQTLALPQAERNVPATRKFLSSYAKDTASRALQSLIWENTDPGSNDERTLSKWVLLLAETLASSGPGIDIQTLLDLMIIYAPTYHSRARAIFLFALKSTPSMASTVETEMVPAFITLLSSPGLYELRKAAQCISCFLHAAPPEILRIFFLRKDFAMALANAYSENLAAIGRSYGGLDVLRAEGRGMLDEWERVWVETKVALMDSFHLLVDQMLKDLSTAPETSFAGESERCFDMLFGLLDFPSSSASSHSEAANSPPTPFLNRPLPADYHYAYNFSRTLASALGRPGEKDARLDILEATFQSFNSELDDEGDNKDAGALRLLLKYTDVAHRIDSIGKGKEDLHATSKLQVNTKGKGKGKETSDDHSLPFNPDSLSDDPDLHLKVWQVLDILPEYSPTYIHALLVHPSYPFQGNAEKVVEALLEGTAPTPEEVEGGSMVMEGGSRNDTEFVYTKDRKNVFDDDVIDPSRLRFGKKKQDEETILRDRDFSEMKADILRRAEAMHEDEDEENIAVQGRDGGIDIAYDDELEPDGSRMVKMSGEGDDGSGRDDEDEEEDRTETINRPMPETILELAYLRDPKLFERDAETRRGKPRAELRVQTGWSDEQIEGWRIMLERNPRKDKILQKHEFAGNRPWKDAGNGSEGGTGSETDGRGRGSGRGRGRGSRGGGRGRGGGHEGSGGNDRDRSQKEKNKASRGNHNRKRGHDKKMARSLGPSI